LLTSTRQQYHERIAQVLAERFPDLAETQPELLAHHYTEAGVTEQAVGSWHKAGQRAIERSANVEAVSHLTTGLALLETLPDTAERTQRELAMLTQLGPAFMATRGVAASEVENTFTRARELCQQVGDVPRLFAVLRGLWNVYLVRGEVQKAYDLAEQLLPLTQDVQDVSFAVEAHWVLGTTLFFLGEIVSALAHLEQGQALRNPHKQRSDRVLQDPDVGCLVYGARTLYYLGYPDQAITRIYQALSLARHMTHPYSIVWCHIFAALIHRQRREWQAAQEQAETAFAGAREHGFALWRATGTIFVGRWLAEQGQVESGIAQIQQGLVDWQATGANLSVTGHLTFLAEAYAMAGQADAGLRALDDALGQAHDTGIWHMAELYHLKGELLLNAKCGVRNAELTPEDCFQKALDVARTQQAKSLELRAATSLAHLWQSQGKRQDAYDLLAPVYEWFTEGFDTADLQEAKALLQELS
jgi:predicted ATPase